VEGYALSSFCEERRCNRMEFLLQILLEITKTIAREGIVFGFKKLTAKKAQKEDHPSACEAWEVF